MSRILKKGRENHYARDLESHPLYVPSTPQPSLPSEEALYSHIQYPSTDVARYAKLRERADQLIVQSIGNEQSFKTLMMAFADLQQQIDAERSIAYSEMIQVEPTVLDLD